MSEVACRQHHGFLEALVSLIITLGCLFRTPLHGWDIWVGGGGLVERG